jgi:kynurenine formamidase
MGTARVVDLTQPLGPRTALWPGSNPLVTRTTGAIDRDGHYARDVSLPEHSGTHLDAPAHFAPGGAFAHEVPAERLVVECAVIDASAECADDPDYALSAERLARDEAEHGRLPEGGALLLRTGWDRFTGDHEHYVDAMDFPGFGRDAAELAIERGCVGLGIDTLSIDPGRDESVPVHHTTLPAGLWHLEGLVNLAALPPRGATLFVGALKLVDGSGTPARVLALV